MNGNVIEDKKCDAYEETVLSVNDWKTRWEEKKIGFHKNTVHK